MMPWLAVAVLSLLAMPQTPQSDYVGENTCLSCHDGYRYKGKHAETTNARTPAATHGCESCHGAGRAHAEAGDTTAIKNPASMSVKEGIAVCAACHDRAAHPAAIGGQTPAADAGCTWCHSVHHATAAKLLKTPRL
jgi:cytochrome c554/c'-like protein